MTVAPAFHHDLGSLPGAAKAQVIADASRMPVALLASADTRWTTAEAADVAGPVFTICRYGDGTRTEVHPLPGAAVRSERSRKRFIQAMFAATVPAGEAVDHLSAFVQGKLQGATVRAGGTWRCYAIVVDETWLVLAVVPDRAGKGTAPNLVVVYPAAPAAGQDRGAAA